MGGMFIEALPPGVRDAVIARDGCTCQMCGRAVVDGVDPHSPDALNIDHIVPFAAGGTHDLSNLRVACADCNQRRPRPVTEAARHHRNSSREAAAERRALRRSNPPTPRTPEQMAELIRTASLSPRQRKSYL